MLYIAKLGYAWLLPPGLFILVGILCLLVFFTTRKFRYLLLMPILAYLLSIRPVCTALIQPLENAYPQPAIEQCQAADAIVILGGGSVGGVPDVDGVGQITGFPANRILAGVRLHRKLNLPIILSGGQVFAYTGTEADIEERVIRSLGVQDGNVIKDNKSRNTVENAKFVAGICAKYGYKRVLLVTSAFHMPRSVAIFQRQGVAIIPYPTDYQVSKATALDAFAFTPSAGELYNASLAIKEYMGIAAVKFNLQ